MILLNRISYFYSLSDVALHQVSCIVEPLFNYRACAGGHFDTPIHRLYFVQTGNNRQNISRFTFIIFVYSFLNDTIS